MSAEMRAHNACARVKRVNDTFDTFDTFGTLTAAGSARLVAAESLEGPTLGRF
jgi:hypothetical protein